MSYYDKLSIIMKERNKKVKWDYRYYNGLIKQSIMFLRKGLEVYAFREDQVNCIKEIIPNVNCRKTKDGIYVIRLEE